MVYNNNVIYEKIVSSFVIHHYTIHQTCPPTSAWYLSVKYWAASVIWFMLRCKPWRWRLKFSAAKFAKRSVGSSLSNPESFSIPVSESESDTELDDAIETDWRLWIDAVDAQRAWPRRFCTSVVLVFNAVWDFDDWSRRDCWFWNCFNWYFSDLYNF